MVKLIFPLVLVFSLFACSADLPPIVDCEPVGDIRPVCGMGTPEDIAALADGRYLLLAHFGSMGDAPGSISLFDTRTEELTPLFPPTDGNAATGNSDWGEPACTNPPGESFSPHGTHLHQLADGRWRYLVVNHGSREAIELFELTPNGAGSTLSWQGCVPAAAETIINDVLGLANGDLVFSRMFHHGGDLEMVKSLLGFKTGDLWRWSRDSGLKVLPGTEAAMPNGLEISADERYIFANMYAENEVWKVDAASGEKLAVAPVASIDNSAWGTDDRLWVASHNGGFQEMSACFQHKGQTCGASFEIVAVNPETMETEVLFSHRGPPMGAATIAVPQGDRVYMGSFAGDRMISVPNFSPAR